MLTYLIRMTFIHPFLGIVCREVTVESETPLWAAITGLERLVVCSLEPITGIEICPVSEVEPAERSETSEGYHGCFQAGA